MIKMNDEQDCIQVGCVLPACCPYLPACTALEGVPGPGGCLVQEGCLPLVPGGVVYYSMQLGRPPPCEQNHRHV